MDLTILPKLTKDYILNTLSQEDIMEKYLGIPVVFDKLVHSPSVIRTDDNDPSFGFKYSDNGKLRCRDFTGAFWGDCFDVVGHVLKIDSKGSREFQMILHTIAKDFRIHKYKDFKEVNNYNKIVGTFLSKKKPKKLKTIIYIIPRQYNYHDLGYWKRFNITQPLLEIGRVYCAEEIHISKNHLDYTKVYRYSTKDPAYCYYGGKDENGIDNWKIYYPLRKKENKLPRFHSNSSFLQGKHLITPDKIGIITKAYKDVLAFRSVGLQAVAPTAESVIISKENYWFMKRRFDVLISCMDYDRTGKRMSQLLRKTYNIQPFMFTNGLFNTTNYHVKDFAEYLNKYGVEQTIILLKKLYKENQEELDYISLYDYNLLKFIS